MNVKEVDGVFHCDCGFSWSRGKNGNHNCADGLRKKIQQLVADNEKAMDSLRQADAAIKLAHEKYSAIAAENVGLKAGRKFFMYSDDAGFETYPTREEAIKAAEEMIDDYRGDAGDGWPEEAGTTRWGVIIQQATECDYEKPSTENGWLGSCDYRLLPETPATDRIVAGIKADGVEEWVSSRGGRWNGTTEEALKFAAQLRKGGKV